MSQNEQILTRDQVISYLMKPLSWLYAFGTEMRNKFFDWGWLKTVEYDVPVVSVGNITVGGTGKTPHVEYLIDELSPYYKIGVLSRGYKRRTRGFVLASSHSTPETIGDEPYQIYLKFGRRAKVAVCESRRKGIDALLAAHPDINLILLDDAFQHRYVKPKVNILLTDYMRPVYADNVLPLGRLRESKHNVSRADMVIVTKVPETMTPIDYRVVNKGLDLYAYQKLYFSGIRYGAVKPVFPEDSRYAVHLSELTSSDLIILLTGIANPRGFVRHFRQYQARVKVMHYPDHHFYSRKDLEEIRKKYEGEKAARKIIMTTEKDAVRLADNPYFPQSLKPYVFYMPIEVEIRKTFDNDDFIETLRRMIDAPTADK